MYELGEEPPAGTGAGSAKTTAVGGSTPATTLLMRAPSGGSSSVPQWQQAAAGGAAPQLTLPRLLDPATLQGVIEESYRPVRTWLRANTARARNYALGALVCTIKLEVPAARGLGDGEIQMLAHEWASDIGHSIPATSTIPAACEVAPTAPPAAGGGLPDISLDKVLKHKLNLYVGTLEISLPDSAELKFREIPLQGAASILIKVKGEVTKLDKLLSGDTEGTPVKLSLGVSLNGIPKLGLEATAAVDLDKKAVSAGLSFTLLGGNCSFKVPYSALDAIAKAEKDLRKYSPAPDVPPGKDKAPDDVVGQLVDIAKIADTLYKAIKAFEDAKTTCVQGPKVGIGPFVTVPFGEPKPDDRSTWGPTWGFGFQGQF